MAEAVVNFYCQRPTIEGLRQAHDAANWRLEANTFELGELLESHHCGFTAMRNIEDQIRALGGEVDVGSAANDEDEDEIKDTV